MKIRLVLEDDLHNCGIQIDDMFGTRYFRLNLPDEGQEDHPFLDVDIPGDRFDLTVVPIMVDYKDALKEMENVEGNTWKDKLAKKAAGFLLSAFENLILRVGCKYHAEGLPDGAVLNIYRQEYLAGSVHATEILEFLPVLYMFYEVSYLDNRFEVVNAFGTNRKAVVNFARKYSLIDFGFQLIFTYPIQVGRVKRLTKDKKIFKTLSKFHHMSEDQRQALSSRWTSSSDF